MVINKSLFCGHRPSCPRIPTHHTKQTMISDSLADAYNLE